MDLLHTNAAGLKYKTHDYKEMFVSGSWVCWLSLHAGARVLPGGMPGFQSLAYWDRGSIPRLCARTSLQV